MGCAKYIRKDYTDFGPGGAWYYVGYDTEIDGLYNKKPTTPLIQNLYSPLSLASFGDDFIIDSENASVGYYQFKYSGLNTTRYVTIKVVADTVTAGTNVTAAGYSSIGTLDLSTVLNDESEGGTWTAITNVGDKLNGSVLTLDGLADGDYQFKYSFIDTGFIDKGCDNCPELESTIIIKINNAITGTITVSDSTIEYKLLPHTYVDETPRKVDWEEYINEYWAQAKFIIYQNDVLLDYTRYNATIINKVALKLGVANNPITFIIPEGSYIKSVTLRKTTDQTTVVVNTDPNTVSIPNLSNSSLYINSLNLNSFADSIARVISDTLNTTFVNVSFLDRYNSQGYIFHFLTMVPVLDTGLRYGAVSYIVKLPNGTEKEIAVGNADSVKDYIKIYESRKVENALYIDYGQLTECPGILSYELSNIWFDSIINTDASTTSTKLVLNDLPTISSGNDKDTATCPAKLLTANVTGCAGGTLTYQWRDQYGGTIATTQSVTVLPNQEYFCKITCSSGSTITLSITI